MYKVQLKTLDYTNITNLQSTRIFTHRALRRRKNTAYKLKQLIAIFLLYNENQNYSVL
ncbi:hypothetical protein HanIR_Chr07g0335021 [Helianthus annuus]|nr:hypothetical protein HanIR_Chr07g0335021 [Helianthus annuus]